MPKITDVVPVPVESLATMYLATSPMLAHF